MTMYMDYIQAKTRQIGRLRKKSGKALDIVTRTINGLQDANAKIEQTLTEMGEYRENLAVKEYELEQEQCKNTRIIENFKALIEG